MLVQTRPPRPIRLALLISGCALLLALGCGDDSTRPRDDASETVSDVVTDTWPTDLGPLPDRTPGCEVDADCEGRFPDLDDCQRAVCDQIAGTCVIGAADDGTPCIHGSACVDSAECAQGVCQGAPNYNCDDGNPCTADDCDPEGGCQNPPFDGPCDDDDPCTTDDWCVDGDCVGQQPADCNDDNPCTMDMCDVAQGCLNITAEGPCDDGDPCTDPDSCVDGACVAGPPICQCETDVDCLAVDDGNLCNGVYRCTDGNCQVDAASVVTCEPVDGDPCLENTCLPNSGACALRPVEDLTTCDDNSGCTIQDVCIAGVCTGVAPLPCDDDNPCTDDGCDPVAGCTNTPNDLPCSDNNACTANDTCFGGVCEPGNNTCTCDNDDQCLAVVAGISACAGTLYCIDGYCELDPSSALDCDDLNTPPCTTRICQPAADACVLVELADGTACDVSGPCTVGDSCVAGTCVGSMEVPCDDGNPCTEDACDVELGCVHQPVDAGCDDGNPCTIGDACQAGSCIPGADACPCETDGDCVPFDDGDLCRGPLVCVAGACRVDPATVVVCDWLNADPCGHDACNPDTGQCEYMGLADGTPCFDSDLCSVSDSCLDGACGADTTADCNDNNPCTDDTCEPGTGCAHSANTATCEDGDPCTVDDACAGGVCVPGVFACNCTTDADCAQLDDGNLCNGTLHCVDEVCVPDPDTFIVCDPSGNTECMVNTCIEDTGECEMAPAPDGSSCSDGDISTFGDTCSGGVCQPGTPMDCNDGNICTDDSTDPVLGCVTTYNTNPCDNGNACTIGDVCENGQCLGQVPVDCDDGNLCTQDLCDSTTGCFTIDIAVSCDDGNPCTAGDVCQDGQCGGTTATDCDDGNTCTDDDCNPTDGCTHADNTDTCDDGDPCTTGDTCSGGACISTGQLDCDDGDPCTGDSCSPGVGCSYTDLTGVSCEDGNACTTGDSCTDGTCLFGTAVDCDDSNECTDDDCDPASGCSWTPNTDACNDGDPCTTGDACVGGNCQSTGVDACDDGNPCTADSCIPMVGCDHQNLTGQSCNDSDACTVNDTCDDGSCQPGSPLNCDDGEVCTDDDCDPASGCTWDNNTSICDDGNVCTDVDVCVDGVCVPGTNTCGCIVTADCASSEDGNLCNGTLHCVSNSCEVDPTTIITCNPAGDTQCTVNTCNPSDGSCTMQAVPDTTPCNDGDACTFNDACSAGTCQAQPLTCNDNNDCTDDDCDAASGCTFTNNTDPCDDSNACTENDTCTGGSCVGSGVVCDDTNDCTTDTCNLASGCVFTNNSLPCDDSNLCTVGDVCVGGGCQSGTPLPCGDGNPCTDDGCDPSSGCTFTPNTDPCDDNNACTDNDTCTGGVCFGSGITCDDGEMCTTDTCNPASGCVFTNNAFPCEDGDLCTVGDLCVGGSCQSGTPVPCNDGNVCTDDSCDPSTGGCQFAPNTDPCDDGNACTDNDTCSGTLCSGQIVDCDDAIACTLDSCEMATGNCLNDPIDLLCDDGSDCSEDTCVPGVGCVNTANSCDTPLPLDCEQTYTGTNVDCGTVLDQFPDCTWWDETGPEVVYEYTGSVDVALTADLTGMSADLDIFVLEVPPGQMCAEDQCIDYGSYGVSDVPLRVSQGYRYFIIIDGYYGATSAYTLTTSCCISNCAGQECGGDDGCGGSCGTCNAGYWCAPSFQCEVFVGDLCNNPVIVDNAALPNYQDTYDSSPGSNDYSVPADACGNSSEWGASAPDVVYSFNPDQTGDYLIELLPDAWDPVLYVATNCNNIGNSCLASVDDGGWGTLERLVLSLNAGTEYFIFVDGWSSGSGPYDLTISGPDVEFCFDAVDNDGDGDVDCADSDCDLNTPPCEPVEATCDDFVDNDGDGDTDCVDNNCNGISPCENNESICGDGFDNDGDGQTDCADNNCTGDPQCYDCAGDVVGTVGCGDTINDTTSGISTMGPYSTCVAWAEAGPERVYELINVSAGQSVTLSVSDPTGSGMDFDVFVLADTCQPASCVAYANIDTTFTADGGTYYVVVDGYQDTVVGDFALNIMCP